MMQHLYFCFNCLSEIPCNLVVLRCAARGCEYRESPKTYAEYLKLGNRLARESRYKWHPHLWVLQLASCTHQPMSQWRFQGFQDLCAQCSGCPNLHAGPLVLECPICRANLELFHSFENPRKIVPVLGAPSSGKTMLIQRLARDLTVIFDRQDKFFGIFNKEGRSYLFNGCDSTGIMEILPEKNVNRTAPIIFYGEDDYRIVYDIPGNWFSSIRQMEENIHILLKSPFIILLIDPYSIPKLRRYLSDVPESRRSEAEQLTAEDIMLNLVEIFNSMDAFTRNTTIPATLFLVLTKAEQLLNVKRYHPDEELRRLSGKLLSFLDTETDRHQLQQVMEAWLGKLDMTSLVVNARQFFSDVRYFPVSALGKAPVIFSEQQEDHEQITSYAFREYLPGGTVHLSKAIFNFT